MRKISAYLTYVLLLAFAFSCSKKSTEIAPNDPLSARKITSNAMGDDYETGRKLGAADALSLAKGLSQPCPGAGSDGNPTFHDPPSEPCPTCIDPSTLHPNANNDPVPLQGQGGNVVCMSGDNQLAFDNTILAWHDSAIQHADAATTPEESMYYNGYAQGLYEWHLPPR